MHDAVVIVEDAEELDYASARLGEIDLATFADQQDNVKAFIKRSYFVSLAPLSQYFPTTSQDRLFD
jgi:hypothetical protein